VSSRLSPGFERRLRRYVLGELDEPLRAELEETLVSDPDAFEALGVIEDELVEEYLDGALDAAERGAFERGFLTSDRRESRLRFARELRERARDAAAGPALRSEATPAAGSTRPRPAWLALAAALAFSLVGNIWLATRPAEPDVPRQPLPAAEARSPVAAAPAPAPGDSAADIARERTARVQAELHAARLERELARARSSVVTLALAAGRLRSAGDAARISLPAEAVAVRLRLELASAAYSSYRAALVDQDGNEVWTASRLEAKRQGGDPVVVLVLPATLLPAGDYEVALSGSQRGGEPELVATYAFRVTGR